MTTKSDDVLSCRERVVSRQSLRLSAALPRPFVFAAFASLPLQWQASSDERSVIFSVKYQKHNPRIHLDTLLPNGLIVVFKPSVSWLLLLQPFAPAVSSSPLQQYGRKGQIFQHKKWHFPWRTKLLCITHLALIFCQCAPAMKPHSTEFTSSVSLLVLF